MDWRYAEKRELSEEDVRAIDYMAEQAELGGQFRLGQYEQNYTIEGTLMRGSYPYQSIIRPCPIACISRAGSIYGVVSFSYGKC
jgi:hypothetical protein